MKSRKTILVVTVLLFFFTTLIGIYNVSVSSVTLQKQNVPMFVLQSSESDVISDSFARALATSPSGNEKNLYLFRQDTQNIAVIAENNGRKIKSIPANSAKALAVNSKGHIFIANDSELSIADAKGKWINNFPIPKTTISIAALSDSDVAVAATDTAELLTIFDKSGDVIRRMGKLKQFDAQNAAQNRFLNAGKIAANQSGDIYHVSMFSPAPVVQKFSKQGQLLKEFAVEGSAVELQSKRANEFLRHRKISCVGGYHVIEAVAVDSTTGHLWIGMNGSSKGSSILPASSVLYEYNSDGGKLAEYALNISSSTEKLEILTDIDEVAVNFPYVYILTSQGKVFRFNLDQRLPATPKQEETDQDNLSFSFISAKWKSMFSAANSTQQGARCPNAITTYSCNRNCPAGSTPSSVDCKAELTDRLNQGEVIISASCNYGVGGENGGCTGSITGCATNGVRIDYSTTLTCNAAPTPTPTPTPDPEPEPTPTPRGEIGGGCDATPWNCSNSPIVIDVSGDGFNLTNVANGVRFDLNSDGQKDQLSWTVINPDDAWLTLDRNGNGTIDNGSELFGNFTPQPTPPSGMERNGFLALAGYDKSVNGGNNDGVINSQDAVFSNLRLWQDTNHNGVSEGNELKTLGELGLAEIELDYKESKRTDEHGNQFKYRAKVKDVNGAQVGRWAWDVFLVAQQPNN